MSELNHFNEAGKAHMVDISDKEETHRIAVVSGSITMKPETLELITSGKAKKGDVLGIARIAGIMASKKTSDLIPLCHPLALTHVDIELTPVIPDSKIICRCTVETKGQTGVEMEALTATQVTLLTIYDMCKAVDRGMVMTDIKLESKSGGKSGNWKA